MSRGPPLPFNIHKKNPPRQGEYIKQAAMQEVKYKGKSTQLIIDILWVYRTRVNESYHLSFMQKSLT